VFPPECLGQLASSGSTEHLSRCRAAAATAARGQAAAVAAEAQAARERAALRTAELVQEVQATFAGRLDAMCAAALALQPKDLA
jgi:hypothetical protein